MSAFRTRVSSSLAYAYQNQVLDAGREAEDAIVTFLRSQEQAQHLALSVNAAARTVEITNEQYKQGAVDFTPLFLFQQQLTDQQDQFAVAQGDIAQGLIAVYRALGGGWQIRLDGNILKWPNLKLWSGRSWNKCRFQEPTTMSNSSHSLPKRVSQIYQKLKQPHRKPLHARRRRRKCWRTRQSEGRHDTCSVSTSRGSVLASFQQTGECGNTAGARTVARSIRIASLPPRIVAPVATTIARNRSRASPAS